MINIRFKRIRGHDEHWYEKYLLLDAGYIQRIILKYALLYR